MIKDVYPAVKAIAISADAGNDLATKPARGLYVGTAGDIIVDMLAGDTEVTFKNVPAGTILPIQINRLRQGSDCVALY